MLRTEEEAAKCWCPFTRVATEWLGRDPDFTPAETMLATTVNRGVGLSADTSCIGSQCMAWQWRTRMTWVSSEISDRGGHWEVIDDDDLPPVGYCGLAGEVR